MPASGQETRNAAAFLLNLVEPDASDSRAAVMGNMLDAYGYSRAELYLAMRELPRDPEASHNYGRGLNLADVERIVSRHRKLRSKLVRPITAQEVGEIIDEYGHEGLTAGHFPRCGFGTGREADTPLFRYRAEPIAPVNPPPITEPTGERKPDEPHPFIR